MGITNTFNSVESKISTILAKFVRDVAEIFGYPKNPGMPISIEEDNKVNLILANLPKHRTQFPPQESPKTIAQIFFGSYPEIDPIPRHIYESKIDGFYNFYIENFRNLTFFPDWISEFLQIYCHICLDITNLEILREGLFLSILFYYKLVAFRISLYWLLSINPYTIPFIYLVTLTDWIEDALAGLVPTVFGLDVVSLILLTIVGKLGDMLNHLVFTMPYLPSEAQRAKIFINGKLTEVVVFRYLPYLWYKYPIPNEIREYWSNERPDILRFMQKNYSHLDIQFLPDPDHLISSKHFIFQFFC